MTTVDPADGISCWHTQRILPERDPDPDPTGTIRGSARNGRR